MAWYPKVRAHYAERMDDFTKADRALWNIMSRPATFSGDWVKRYPAETHIDILSEGRGFGLGRRLIESMEKELQRHGVRGFHLGVDPLNTNAQAFYEHLGLELLVPVSAGGPTYGRVLQE
jgi:GNAT superfamily N-acetyltransferase